MKTDPAVLPKPGERIPCIDRCRGILVVYMIFFGLLEKFENFGFLSTLCRHGEDGPQLLPGFSPADLGEPLFLLMVALCFLPSFAHRLSRDGKKKTYLHFVVRDLLIIGLGCGLRLLDQISRGKRLALVIPAAVVWGAGVVAAAVSFALKKSRPRASARCMTVACVSLCAVGVFNVAVSFGNAVYTFAKGKRFIKLWDVLQSIGSASLLLLLLAETSAWIRGAVGFSCIAGYSLLHQIPGNMELLDLDTMGGFFAILAWGGMLLVFSVMAELFYRDRAARAAGKRAFSYWIAAAVLCLVAVPGVLLFPMNKGSVSPAYILVCLPLASLLFGLVSLTEKWQPKFAPFSLWGKNPLVFYLLQFFFTDLFFVIAEEGTVPLYVAIPYVTFVLCLFTFIARRLAKRPRGAAL